MNFRCAVQNKRKCKSHVSCICIAGVSTTYMFVYILIGVLGVSLYLFQLCLSCSPLLCEQYELHPAANFITTVFVVYFQSGILNISRKQKRLLLMEKEQLISGVSHSYEESGEHETDPLLPGRRHHIN